MRECVLALHTVSIHFYLYICGHYIRVFTNVKIINQAKFYTLDFYINLL